MYLGEDDEAGCEEIENVTRKSCLAQTRMSCFMEPD